LNTRPVVGIMSQPCGEEVTSNEYKDYIAASYVKYLEAAGARVVPIPYDATFEQLDDMVAGLNGVLFPGGGASLDADSKFFLAANHVFNKVIEANDAGEHMPVWGTCLGFQTISVIVSQDHNLLKPFDSENMTLALEFTPLAANSRMFGADAPSSIVDNLKNNAITLNNHAWGVTPEEFSTIPKLANFFNVLSTNKDRAGKVFVSTIEAKNYPIFASQWHPEKNQFEWNPTEAIAHSLTAIQSMQYMADFFVNQARQNTRHYSADSLLEKRLIYQYTPVYTGGPGKSFEQSYYNIKFV